MFLIVLLLLNIASCTARDIVFPPSIPVQLPLDSSVNAFEHADWARDSRFHGLTTFANLPYVPCFGDSRWGESYDIAVLGAQFDTATTGRPGARFGPTGIRLGSQRISAAEYDIRTGKSPLQSWARVVDCGDPPLTWLDNTAALKQLEQAHKIVSGRQARSVFQSKTPRIVTLGGDHTTTLAALRSTHKQWGQVSVIHFDSHIDTWDPDVLGGGISDYAGLNHGTFLHIAHEEGLIRNNSIHAGIRAPVMRRKGDLRNDIRCGFELVHARDIDRLGVDGIISRIKDRVAESKVYISVDIDVLDPAFAPATGTAEVGGWSTRELLSILEGLEGMKVIGGDVVEVAPVYDNAGETTGLAAAEVAKTIVGLMVEVPVKE